MEKFVYQTDVMNRMIRESLEDPYGRNFLFLLYLSDRRRFSGKYLTPYFKPYRCVDFDSFTEFQQSADQLIQKILRRDQRDEAVKCCQEWLIKGLPAQSDYVLCCFKKADGDWAGRYIKKSENRICHFDGKLQLKKLMTDRS